MRCGMSAFKYLERVGRTVFHCVEHLTGTGDRRSSHCRWYTLGSDVECVNRLWALLLLKPLLVPPN